MCLSQRPPVPRLSSDRLWMDDSLCQPHSGDTRFRQMCPLSLDVVCLCVKSTEIAQMNSLLSWFIILAEIFSLSFCASFPRHLLYEDPGWFDAKGQGGSNDCLRLHWKGQATFLLNISLPPSRSPATVTQQPLPQHASVFCNQIQITLSFKILSLCQVFLTIISQTQMITFFPSPPATKKAWKLN